MSARKNTPNHKEVDITRFFSRKEILIVICSTKGRTKIPHNCEKDHITVL